MSTAPDLTTAVHLLEGQASALLGLCRSLPEHIVLWSPPNGGWSIHIVLCHLLDEERDDFRARIRQTFTDPKQPWPPIDPEGWVLTRKYALRNYTQVLEEFQSERRASVEWLKQQTDSRWRTVYCDPRVGSLSAADLLAAWLDHDRIHLRQILRLLHQTGEVVVPDAKPDYAGKW